MEFFNSLNLKQIKGGTKLKQGDLGSVLSYSLTDENGQEITSFDNKTAYINLVLDDKIWFTTTTLVDISRVTFRIDKAIPIGLYYLEIKIDDYIFPSDRDSIILIEEGSTPYDLKELVPNYDVNMTLKGILSDLSQKGIDINDLKTKMSAIYNNALADHAEITAARGTHPNLRSRLDEADNKQKQTTAQLAQKANKDEVTNVMTPRGTIAYASLPKTGNSVGWYYYCPDGDGTHGAGNYVWNGTSWYFGGTGDEGYNLLKKDLVNLKSVYNDETFNFVGGYNYFNYDFIAGHNYRLTNDSDSMIGIWTANSNDEVIETISGGADTHIVFDFNCSTNAEKIKIFAHGIGTLKIVDQSAKINEIENDISNISKKIVVGRNKFNKYDIKIGYFLMYNTGVENVNNDWCYTDFTEVKPSTEYYTNFPYGHYCFYDEDKKYITGVTSTDTFTTPSTAKYIRASVAISAIDSIYIYEGNSGGRYEPFKYKFKYDDDYKNKQSVIIVDKSGNGDYTSVTQACADAPNGSTVFIKSGVYENEQITGTYHKKLYLIGESAQDCIIKNNTGEYLHEPIQIGSGLLRNLTFYAELEDGQERKEGQIEYGVHVESHNLSNDNLTIENCILKSDYNVALGMGMRGGCNVIIKNCHLIGTHNGALTIHDSNYDDYLGVQNVSLINNIIEVTNNTTCINFQSQEKEASIVNIECIGNRVYSHQNGTLVGFGNYYGGTGSEDDWQGLKNWRLKGTSWGNSTDILN